MWAQACTNWSNNGTCNRGISCKFAHQGFPVSENRCITCGKNGHGNKECTAPGGGKDPNRDASWDEYRARKDKEAPAKAKGNGKEGKGKEGKGKEGKGNGKKGGKKGAGRGKDSAKAALDQEVSRASSAVTPAAFPRHCIGLDSWANVHLSHRKPFKGFHSNDTLTQAHGSCKCSREVGDKGVPRVLVPFDPAGDNIDLFPEGFLYERGCNIVRADTHTLTTPKGRVVEIKMWGSLPYIAKEDLHKVISGLPEHTTPGRNGLTLQVPTAARVCRNTMSETRSHLKHLLPDMSKPQFNNVVSKYKNLPDTYYGGDTAKIIGPDQLKEKLMRMSGDQAAPAVKLWEWYS